MRDPRIENIVGALALALSDAIVGSAQTKAPEPGPATAALALLGHDPGMTIERLRRSLGLSHPGAVRLVDRLTADGLVVRVPSRRDRRAVALHLTEAGAAGCAAILAARQGGLADALAGLAPDELATFGALAEKVLRRLVRDLDHAYAVCRLCNSPVCDHCPVDDELHQRAGATA